MRNTPVTAAKGSRLEAQASFSLHCLSPLDARKENMTAIYEKGRAKMDSILEAQPLCQHESLALHARVLDRKRSCKAEAAGLLRACCATTFKPD